MAGDRDYQLDWISLGGEKSPGIATIKNAASLRDWEQRKGYGLSGASSVYTGDSLSDFEIEFKIWDNSELRGSMFRAWYVFAQVLRKVPRGKRPKALTIFHPLLAEIGITRAVVREVGQFTQDKDGIFTKPVKFLEYREPLPILAKPKGAIPNAAEPPADATSAADLQIQALRTQLAGLAGP